VAAERRAKSKIVSQLARERRKGQEKRSKPFVARLIFAATPTLDGAIWRSLWAHQVAIARARIECGGTLAG
jgi:hypothetical protein